MARHNFKTTRIVALVMMTMLTLQGCQSVKRVFVGDHGEPPKAPDGGKPPVIRQPVVPEMLVNCRGHVLVPALGMVIVLKGKTPPEKGQYIREESLTPPYRILPPGAGLSADENPTRLNVELDQGGRVIGLYCG